MTNFAQDAKSKQLEDVVDFGPAVYRRAGKRLFDLALALLILPLILPVIALLWLLVVRDGGNGFFGHKRVGRGGKVFRCWKLRTMVVDAEDRLREHLANNPEAAEEWARDHKLTDDPRITRLGAFMRKTSLDELPQIWNVIRGDMSFVGPRPIVRMELHKYGMYRPVYLSMTPGITGLWQVSEYRHELLHKHIDVDVEYVQQVSLGLDLRIIGRTLLLFVRPTGR